jgi:hypothetical protein
MVVRRFIYALIHNAEAILNSSEPFVNFIGFIDLENMRVEPKIAVLSRVQKKDRYSFFLIFFSFYTINTENKKKVAFCDNNFVGILDLDNACYTIIDFNRLQLNCNFENILFKFSYFNTGKTEIDPHKKDFIFVFILL